MDAPDTRITVSNVSFSPSAKHGKSILAKKHLPSPLSVASTYRWHCAVDQMFKITYRAILIKAFGPQRVICVRDMYGKGVSQALLYITAQSYRIHLSPSLSLLSFIVFSLNVKCTKILHVKLVLLTVVTISKV